MAIPFYENEEHLQTQQHNSEEIDQVDGHVVHNQNVAMNQDLNSPPGDTFQGEYHAVNHPASVAQQDMMAWKILAVAMCKALKDHYQQNMVNSSSYFSSTALVNEPSTGPETQTAIIQILPNGQVKPQWN